MFRVRVIAKSAPLRLIKFCFDDTSASDVHDMDFLCPRTVELLR
jgi:hypothetical protein